MKTLSKLQPARLAQCAKTVVRQLNDPHAILRSAALVALGFLEPEALAHHAKAVAAKLEDFELFGDGDLQRALSVISGSGADDPALGGTVVAFVPIVRVAALQTLRQLDPATLAQYALAVIARLDDIRAEVRAEALHTLDKLDPPTLVPHAKAVIKMLEDGNDDVVAAAMRTLRALPSIITRDIHFESDDLRSRLLGRLAWYKCRLRLRLRRITLRWYALPYRPGGPGHARDLEAWDEMSSNL